jgi:hypothetical protein
MKHQTKITKNSDRKILKAERKQTHVPRKKAGMTTNFWSEIMKPRRQRRDVLKVDDRWIDRQTDDKPC